MKRLEALKFKFSTIKVATNNFSNANKLGEGSFQVDFEVAGNDSNLLICDVFNCGQLSFSTEPTNQIVTILGPVGHFGQIIWLKYSSNWGKADFGSSTLYKTGQHVSVSLN